jgi:hypothetical protein
MLIVDRELALRLRMTTLRGYELLPFAIAVNQSEARNPVLNVLQSVGANCERPLRIIGAKNECPYCADGFIICESCGWTPWKCPRCRREIITVAEDHKGAGDERALMKRLYGVERVLDLRKWDGSDFIGSHDGVMFLSKRAFDWIVAIHAGPLMARRTKVCLDGMCAEQRRWLRKVNDPASVES